MPTTGYPYSSESPEDTALNAGKNGRLLPGPIHFSLASSARADSSKPSPKPKVGLGDALRTSKGMT